MAKSQGGVAASQPSISLPNFSNLTWIKMQPRLKPRDVHQGDRIFFGLLRFLGVALMVMLGALLVELAIGSWPALQKFGFDFVTQSVWDPVQLEFGALPVIFGTLMSSFLALLFAVPLSIGVALFVTEIAPQKVAAICMFLVEMLASIPSVVYGLWGILVLAPFVRDVIQPFLQTWLGFLPFFKGTPFGLGMLTAGIILAIMIVPTIASVCREVFRIVPSQQKEAALGLGATRWEMMRIAVLRSSGSGIIGAVVLGLGRALGETMAVTMVIGNRAEIALSLFAPGQTMASVIANEYAEATSDMHIAALICVGLVLFVVTFAINVLAQMIVSRLQRRFAHA